MVYLLLLAVVALLVIIFTIQNATPAIVSFFFWQFNASLGMVVILSVLSGMIIMALLFFAAGTKKYLRKREVKP